MKEAIADAGLGEAEISNERTGLVAGSGGPTTGAHRAGGHHRQGEGAQAGRARSWCRAPCRAPSRPTSRPPTRSRASAIRSARPARPRRTASATPSNASSSARPTACSPAAARSSTGRCRCCSTPWAPCRPSTTTRPRRASRAYDKDRDGFVISGGGGMVVLEELERRPGARRQDLRRGHRLRRHLRRRRHGGAVRRRRGALHEARDRRLPGRGAAQRAGRLHQHPRHLDAGRRHHRARRHPRASSATTSCRPSARPSR